ncbi:MAG: DUF4350 domain-containing protein [Thermoplasmatota archaeon]
MKRSTLAILAIAIVVVLVGGAFLALAAQGSPAERSYGGGASDLSDFRSDLQASGYSTASIEGSTLMLNAGPAPSKTLLIVAGVQRPYRPSEVAEIDQFVQDGGHLILADDTGNGNQVSTLFGVQIQNVELLEPTNYVKDANFSFYNATIQITGNSRSFTPVVFDVPGYLNVNASTHGQFIANSTSGSWADLRGTHSLVPGDLPGPFPMIFEANRGKGQAIFIADSEVFSSALFNNGAWANKKFAEALVSAMLPDGGTVVFDDSRHGDAFPANVVEAALSSSVVAFREPGPSLFLLAALLVGAASIVILRPKEDSLGHHAASLDKASPVRLDEPARRLARAARAKLRNIHGDRPDVAKVTTDRRIAQLVETENGIMNEKDLPDLIARVRSYGEERAGGRVPP